MRARPREGFCVCVGGIPGVGKTSLLQAHVRAREPRDRQITGSSVVKAIIAPATVQDLDRWPEERRVEVREESIRRLVGQRREVEGRLLVDGHFTLRNRSTFAIEPIFTPGDCGFYDALTLIEAPAEQVMAFRRADARDRGVESLLHIEEHLAAERAEWMRLAAAMRVPYLVISVVDLPERLLWLAAFLDEHASLSATR